MRGLGAKMTFKLALGQAASACRCKAILHNPFSLASNCKVHLKRVS